jgi:hypothetical protein
LLVYFLALVAVFAVFTLYTCVCPTDHLTGKCRRALDHNLHHHSLVMMSARVLLDLPNELLALILSCLRAFEIEHVAKAFNHRLTAICIPFLHDRIAATKNERRMTRMFTRMETTILEGIEEYDLYKQWGLASDLHPPQNLPTMNTFPCLDYLDLNGNLEWTNLACGHKPVSPQDPDYVWFCDPPREAAASRAQMDELIAAARQLSLSLPACFLRFMTDRNMQSRFPDAHNAFDLGPLRRAKCGMFDIDGYMVPFAWDHDYSVHFYLFLDVHGASSVIASFNLSTPDVKQVATGAHTSILSGLDKELGIVPIDPSLLMDVDLYATSFEEFLVRMFFTLWGHITLEVKEEIALGPIAEPLKQFLVNV